ncbi:MAG: hypothetical protein Q9191_004175 [Dirinaria sp. TL-2023a]
MNSHIFARALGTFSPQALQRAETSRLLNALEAASDVKFDGRDDTTQSSRPEGATGGDTLWAHKAGVNCVAIDKFEGRYMLTGGADPSIKLWDLENAETTSKSCVHKPIGSVERYGIVGKINLKRPSSSFSRSSETHRFGITHVSFYPFDSLAFLSSSYDHALKIYDSQTLTPSASFDLASVVYSHALSPIAAHLLVACATQIPAVRLVDLRSGASAHSLSGHQGAVLTVCWSPQDGHILASGGTDGTVRLWDIRRSASSLGVLDLEDSVGMWGEDGLGKNARPREHGKAHVGTCNGVTWTDDGKYLITAGHDERVRVWDSGSGANALAHFGPTIKNTHLSTLLPLILPSNVAPWPHQVMFYPNEKEILMFDLLEGTLLKRLRIPGVAFTATQARSSAGHRNLKTRITSLAWRTGTTELYSAHSDGLVRPWMPRTAEEAELDSEEALEGESGEEESRKRKRQALDDVFRDLTKQKITFI